MLTNELLTIESQNLYNLNKNKQISAFNIYYFCLLVHKINKIPLRVDFLDDILRYYNIFLDAYEIIPRWQNPKEVQTMMQEYINEKQTPLMQKFFLDWQNANNLLDDLDKKRDDAVKKGILSSLPKFAFAEVVYIG